MLSYARVQIAIKVCLCITSVAMAAVWPEWRAALHAQGYCSQVCTSSSDCSQPCLCSGSSCVGTNCGDFGQCRAPAGGCASFCSASGNCGKECQDNTGFMEECPACEGGGGEEGGASSACGPRFHPNPAVGRLFIWDARGNARQNAPPCSSRLSIFSPPHVASIA